MAIYKLGMDLGNLLLKGALLDTTTGEMECLKMDNRISTIFDIDVNSRKLQYNGRTLYVGAGELQHNVVKHERNNIMEQVLVMAHELTKDKESITIELGLGLPPKQYNNKEYRKSFIKKIKTGEPIKFRVNDDYKEITIEKVRVYYEGYSALYNIIDKQDLEDLILVLDCGGSTIDACGYRLNPDTECHNAFKTHTVETGNINLIEELRHNINEKLNANIAFQTIDDAIRAGKETFRYAKKNHNMSEFLPYIESSIDMILNDIQNVYGALDQYQIILVGGGAKLVEIHAAKSIADNLELDEDTRFYANARGYAEQLEAEEE